MSDFTRDSSESQLVIPSKSRQLSRVGCDGNVLLTESDSRCPFHDSKYQGVHNGVA